MATPVVSRLDYLRARYRVDENGCWIWPMLRSDGYGFARTRERSMLAHRFSYEAHYGPIPDGLCVCHKCDVRACVNPEHLFLGTLQDNNADMFVKGRNRCGRGERSGMRAHPESYHWVRLTEADVREIKAGLASGVKRSELAARFGVCRGNIDAIRLGKSWRHVK